MPWHRFGTSRPVAMRGPLTFLETLSFSLGYPGARPAGGPASERLAQGNAWSWRINFGDVVGLHLTACSRPSTSPQGVILQVSHWEYPGATPPGGRASERLDVDSPVAPPWGRRSPAVLRAARNGRGRPSPDDNFAVAFRLSSKPVHANTTYSLSLEVSGGDATRRPRF